MTDRLVPLETLYATADAHAAGGAQGTGGRAERAAVLDRLAANRRVAEAYGWTACTLERAAGRGRPRAWGVPPAESQRRVIPDWPFEPRY